MKNLVIVAYWATAVMLISFIVLSLGYTFPEALFIGAVFLPGAFFSVYFHEKVFRQKSVKNIVYVLTGMVVAEILLILSAHFLILEMRGDLGFTGIDYFDLPDILVNPVFIIVLISAFAAGNFFIWRWLESKSPEKDGNVTFISDRHKVTLPRNWIEYIESNDTLTFVVDNDGRRYKNRTPISSWENILGSSFLRIHRSYIVRTNAVESVMQNSISLYSGTELPVSRGYKDRVAGILADCIYHRKLSNG